MPKMKTYKGLSKRVSITKRGKVMKRRSGQGHFNSRESGNTTRNKRRDDTIDENSFGKNIKRILSV